MDASLPEGKFNVALPSLFVRVRCLSYSDFIDVGNYRELRASSILRRNLAMWAKSHGELAFVSVEASS